MNKVEYEVRHEHGEHYAIASLAVKGLYQPVREDGATRGVAAEELAIALGELLEVEIARIAALEAENAELRRAILGMLRASAAPSPDAKEATDAQ